ncbi:nitrogen fixation protein FixH [Caldalkalibacillus uzonensis]|uniref:Nitrogen fixation protein FixH n=1 Tax=Caldalkalibacillus uzonensis TaxID=353224 RepID=A0ABU0CT76_9BACI|nr:FixH family protein [Caldalkalibacillus uzonensis]MDQ0339079.1 nitrogen fixation protein FixH [Caldalkalibacillus uzonensis]
MKKYGRNIKYAVVLMVILMAMIGCSSGPAYEAEITAEGAVHEDKVVLHLTVTEGEQPVSGLDIKGILEMRRMDHGIIEVHFVETEAGTYRGEAQLPMGGEWIATLQIDNGQEHVRQIVEFEVMD